MSDSVKIVLLGSSGAGKSCLLTRFSNETFEEGSVTIAGAFVTKSVLVGTQRVRLHIWDTAGSEVYNSITRMYYRHAVAAILCYDITSYKTFVELKFWANQLLANEPECRLYLCGCKLDKHRTDSGRRQVPIAEAKEFAAARGAAFFETSARTGENVDALFNRICSDEVGWNFVSITTGRPTTSCNDKKRPFALSGWRSANREHAQDHDDQLGVKHQCFHQCRLL